MASRDPSGPAQTRRLHTLATLCVIAVALVPMLAACGGVTSRGNSGAGGPSASPLATPGSASSPIPISTAPASALPTANVSASALPTANASAPATPTPGPANSFRQYAQAVARLLRRQAVWQAPKRIKVGQTARIGLVIGDPSRLKAQIKQLVPSSYPKPAGNVQVGPIISVKLTADPNDASVTPNAAIDNSIGERTALLWTWYVNAKHPNRDLLLTAEIDTRMSGSLPHHQELALTIPVDRTVQYTLYQIFSNWATWAAIFAALGTAVGWIWRRRKKQQRKKSKNKKSKIKKPKGKTPLHDPSVAP